jgi:uncharacterized protein (DUF4415 family)
MKKINGSAKLTTKQKDELKALEKTPEAEIDFSDIPEWTEEDFANAIRLNGRSFSDAMKLYKVKKAPISARIDQDILEWLKSQGEGYQTRLNTILRIAMLNDLKQHRQKK